MYSPLIVMATTSNRVAFTDNNILYGSTSIDLFKLVKVLVIVLSMAAYMCYSAGVILVYRLSKLYILFLFIFHMIISTHNRSCFQIKFIVVAIAALMLADTICCIVYRLLPPISLFIWPSVYFAAAIVLEVAVRRCGSSYSSIQLSLALLHESLALWKRIVCSCFMYVITHIAAINTYICSSLSTLLTSILLPWRDLYQRKKRRIISKEKSGFQNSK